MTTATPPAKPGFTAVKKHTRGVSLVKRLLVAAALLLTVALIAWPLLNPVEKHLKLSFTQMTEAESGKPHMLNPKFQGVDDHGQPYTVYAESATQEAKDKVTVKIITGDITLKNNGWVHFSSRDGIIKVKKGWASLSGDVNVSSNDGYTMRTEHVEMELKAGTASGQSPVTIEGPLGVLEATGFVLDNNAGTVTFSGPVKMVVHPDKARK